MSERRCPSCGALVAADAEWCGQCYASLRASVATPHPAASGAPAGSMPTTAPFARHDERTGAPTAWRCPTCEAENELGTIACRLCGTPFGRLFDDPATRPPDVSPTVAAGWSLLLPGLGHWMAGRRADAVARFVLAAWVGGMLVLLLASRGSDGFGSVGPLVALFAAASVAVWSEAVVDARRVASGLPPAVSSRMLLWGCVALIGLSIALSTLIALTGFHAGAPGGPSG
jgi:hypothetical protein